MDSIVDKALKRLRELDLERRNLELFLSTYEALTGTKIVRDELLAVHNSVEPKENKTGTDETPRKRTLPGQIARISERIMMELNRPLTRGELVNELEKRDVQLKSDDKAKYVGTILWRHRDRFRNIEGSGYWLAARPVPGELAIQDNSLTKESK